MTATPITTAPTIPTQGLRGRRRAWTPPAPAMPDLADRLADVRAGVVTLENAEQSLVTAALLARTSGATWQALGDALGVGARAAWQRYSDAGRQR